MLARGSTYGRTIRGLLLITLSTTLSMSIAKQALAEPPDKTDKTACLNAYEQGQRKRREGDLIKAREHLLVCGREPCSPVLRADCAEWLRELEKVLPNVIFVARGPNETDMGNVRVLIDGAVIAQHLDGRAVAVNPGEHLVRFKSDDGQTFEQRIIVREGETARRVVADFRASSAPPRSPAASEQPAVVAPSSSSPSSSSSSPSLWPVFVLGGLGAAAAANFAYFGLSGRSQQKSELDPCKPNCPSSVIDSVRTKYIVADVSLGVSLVSLGAAVFLWLSRPQTTAQRAAPGAPLFRLQANPLGGEMNFAVQF